MSVNSVKVSIAMCTFNGERFIREQLDSIVNQTYSDLEIIICDDGSNDGTCDIVRDYAGRDSRIRFVQNTENLGFIGNFEKALSMCSGVFIALADQDDVWLPQKIEVLMSEIGDNLLLYSAVRLIDENGAGMDKVFPSVKRLEGDVALSLIVGNCVTGHACLIRRELLELALPFPGNVLAHDQWLAVVAASQGKLKASEQVLSLYRQHETNAILSNKAPRKVPRYVKKLESDVKMLGLVNSMLDSGLFSAEQEVLLQAFRDLIQANSRAFYNAKLARFLKSHRQDFLALFDTEEKADKMVKKLCRGKWYLKLLPFS